MGVGSGPVGRWTRRFVLTSALGFLGLAVLVAGDATRQAIAVVGVFWFVLPMVFGMAYVLLPPYVGRTFGVAWLPGVQFGATVVGALGLYWATVAGGPWWVGQVAVGAWSVGVLCFSGGLAWTAVPAVLEDPAGVFRLGDRPQRSTRLATALLPVGIAILLIATGWLALAARSGRAGFLLEFSSVVHLLTVGFAGLLVFALGARLLRGFFHVDPPRVVVWATLAPGAVAPPLLATRPLGGRLFLVGATLEVVAMVAYLALVAVVAVRADRARVGLYGILAGAIAGVAGVTVAGLAVTGLASTRLLDLHAVLVLQGFFGLTIVGYAVQFFPVTAGQFRGATRRGVLAVTGLLAGGIAIHAVGVLAASGLVAHLGGLLGVAGATGYCWLIGRRLLQDRGA